MRVLILIAAMILLPACAVKPIKNERSGMLDRLAQGSTGRKFYRVDETRSAEAKRPQRVAADELKKIAFEWPLKNVEITSNYGKRGDGFHEGIDLRAKVGTPVHAAQSGLVIHSGSQISGYGKMIVVRHSHGWATIYAHNSKLLVKQGQQVKKGQRIAISGKTGRASGPHLHFEVRNGVAAYDPMEVIGRPNRRPEVKKTVAKRPAARVVSNAPSKAVRRKQRESR